MICFTKDSFTKQGQQPTGGEITLMFNPDPDRWGLSPPDVYDDFIREELLLLLLENPDAFGAFDHVERMDIPGGYIALKYSGERTARVEAAVRGVNNIVGLLTREAGNEMNPQEGYTGIGSTLGDDFREWIRELPAPALILCLELIRMVHTEG